MTTIAVAVVGTNLVLDYGTPEAAHAAMAAIQNGTTADWLEGNITDVITPEAVKRVLIAHWPTSSIPDLTDVAAQVCSDIHRLIVGPDGPIATPREGGESR